jgi:hypothetical protein
MAAWCQPRPDQCHDTVRVTHFWTTVLASQTDVEAVNISMNTLAGHAFVLQKLAPRGPRGQLLANSVG